MKPASLLIFQERACLSVDALITYLRCPRRYAFRFVEGAEPEFEASFDAFKHALLRALAAIQGQCIVDREEAWEATQDLFERYWREACARPLRFVPGMNSSFLTTLGRLFLQSHIAPAGFFSLTRAWAAFVTPLRDPADDRDLGMDLIGTFDCVCEGDVIIAFRSAHHSMTEDEMRLDPELSAYAFAYHQDHGILPRLRMVMLYTDGAGGVDQRETKRTHEDLRFFVATVREAMLGMEMMVFPPNPGGACSSCEFRTRCSNWGRQADGSGGSDPAPASPNTSATALALEY